MRWQTAGNMNEDNFIFGGKIFGYLSIQFILWVNVNEMADHRRYDWRFFSYLVGKYSDIYQRFIAEVRGAGP